MDSFLAVLKDNGLMGPTPSATAVKCYKEGGLCFNKEYNSLVSLEVVIGGHAAYIVIVMLLKAFMNGRQPFECKLAMKVYNTIQVVVSVAEVVSLGPFVANYVFNLNGEFNKTIEFWIGVHFLTKFLDFFDSFFMVLRNKSDQLSFLHVYHHLTIGLIWGLLLHAGIGNGTAFFGAWINSLVHALMYFHYLWTSFGLKNPFKKYLTLFQMFQFSLCILQAVLVFPLDGNIPKPWATLQLCYHCSLLALFRAFYIADRKKEKKAKKN